MTRAADIARLMDVTFRAAMAEMAQLRQEEARLRGAIDDLDSQARRAVADAARVEGMTGTGADLAWRSWLLSRRRALMMELATLLARKAETTRKLQREGGRAQASAALAEREAAAERRGLTRQRQMVLESQMVLAAWRDGHG